MTVNKSSHQESNCQQCQQKVENHCKCTATYRRNKIIEYVSYDEWLPNVRILAPDVPDSILLDFVRRGCIEFAKKSGILTRNIHIDVIDCVADYYPCLGENERIRSVNYLAVNGQCYRSVSDTCDWNVGDYRYWFRPPNSLEIHPAPKGGDCADSVVLNVEAIPREDSSVVDSIIYDEYFEAIEHYAVAKAHLIAEIPVTSGEAHVYRLNEFKKSVNEAKLMIAENYSNDRDSFDNLIGGCRGCL